MNEEIVHGHRLHQYFKINQFKRNCLFKNSVPPTIKIPEGKDSLNRKEKH